MEKIKFFLGCLILISGCMVNILVQVVFKEIVNSCSIESIIHQSYLILLFLIIGYALFWTINQIANILSLFILDPILNSLCKNIVIKAIYHTMKAPYNYFLNKESKSLSSYFDIIFTATSNIFSNLIVYIIPSIIEMTITFIFFYYLYGFFYGVLLLILLIIFCFFIYISIQHSRIKETEYYKYLDLFHAKINETINYIKIIKTYDAYLFEKEKIDYILTHFFSSSEKRNRELQKAQLFQIITCGIILAIITSLSRYHLNNNIIPIGDFILINNYFIQFTIPITFLGYVFTEIYKNIIFLKKALKIFTLSQDTTEKLANFSSEFTPLIEFKEISLHLNNKKILQNISFTINPYEKIAILGHSGSGKSTCFNLLTQLCNPTNGKIYLNKEDIQNINHHSLYEKITLVTQTPYLFYGTIAENVRYNTQNITDEEIIDILDQFYLYEKIKKMEHGIYTDINSIELSGGEKQRIALARGILRNTSIFLLDEVTSALDSAIAYNIEKYLSKKLKKSTVLMITHHLELIKHIDKIIIMENGKIIAIGNHDELVASCETYQKLIKG